jgi:hypothetical protein
MKFFVLLVSLLWVGGAQAQTNSTIETQDLNPTTNSHIAHWRINFSPYSIHYTHNPQHRHVWMIGAEKQRSDSYVWGGTYFSNSFGQDSGYVYGGQRFEKISRYDAFFAQWTAGLMYGYKGEFAHKVPLNYRGFSPGLVLSLGWKFTPTYSAQLNVLGNSAMMFQVSMELN